MLEERRGLLPMPGGEDRGENSPKSASRFDPLNQRSGLRSADWQSAVSRIGNSQALPA